MTAADQLLLGSGWNQTVWCHNPGCRAPIPAGAVVCPDCLTICDTDTARRALALFEGFRVLTPRQVSVVTRHDVSAAMTLLIALEALGLVALSGSRFVRTVTPIGGLL